MTTTLANYRQQLIDNVSDDLPTLSWLVGKLGQSLRGSSTPGGANGSRLRLIDGGESIVEHILYEFASSVKAYAQYETLDLTPQDGMTIARYSWRQYAATVAISGLEERNNNGDAQMIDLLEAKTNQAEASLRNRLSNDIWTSAVGGNDGKSWDGLGALCSSSGTVGGLSASTFTWWASTQTSSGSFAAQGLKDMRTTYNTVSFGSNKPDYITSPQAIFEYFESSLQPQERYTNTKAANTGFENLTFKAIPYIFDRDAPSGTIFMLNSNALKLVCHKQAYFATGKFMESVDQDARSCKILLQGNLTTNERRKLAKLTSITA